MGQKNLGTYLGDMHCHCEKVIHLGFTGLVQFMGQGIFQSFDNNKGLEPNILGAQVYGFKGK